MGNTVRGDAVVKALALLYRDGVDGGDWDASGFPDPVSATYKFDRHDFERHLEAASAVAARRGTVHDLFAGIVGPPPVLLTFDDGGASAYGCVADLLERAGWRGHFFITTDYLGTPGFVGRAQVRELAGRGGGIGPASWSQPAPTGRCHLGRLSDQREPSQNGR